MLLCITSLVIKADHTRNPEKAFQLSFAYPIGTYGLQSVNYANNISLNIIYGVNGGLNGMEFGSVLNVNTGYVSGLQFAGVMNMNTQRTDALQFAGVANVCNDSVSGLQLAGVFNLSRHRMSGIQASVVNVATHEMSGIQLGVIDYTHLMNGIQWGVINSVSANMTGIQLGVVNSTSHDMIGMQIGVLNHAQKSTGLQLGVINISTGHSEVLPIGIINIVKNGYYAFEVSAGETLYGNFAYKMGVDKFYTIFKGSYSYFSNKPVYGFGLGFGTKIKYSDLSELNVEASSVSLVYDDQWENTQNQLYQVSCHYKYYLTKAFSLFVGPSLNVYLTDQKVNGEFNTLEIPYTLYSKEWSDKKLSSWIGVNAGFSVDL